MEKPKGVGAAYLHPEPTPFAEFVEKEVARRKTERETPGSIEALQHQKLQQDLEKIRQKKARQRARNPYRFD